MSPSLTKFALQHREVLSVRDLSLQKWDVLISSYNASARVRTVFDVIDADKKYWVMQAEYEFADHELPTSGIVVNPGRVDEAQFWQLAFESMGLSDASGLSLVVDSTGFMRPHLLVLLMYLKTVLGARTVDFLYSDPVRYVKNEATQFSDGAVTTVRQVRGFEGSHIAPRDGDLLIIGTGYDEELIRRVAEDKSGARKVQMFGLPSLQPHMYQENRLQAAKAEEAARTTAMDGTLFAPANNPFVTADVLHRAVERHRVQSPFSNLYLSPLGTKAQTLGFGLYYLSESVGSATSIVFPFAERYARETTHGVSRVWRYSVELDWI